MNPFGGFARIINHRVALIDPFKQTSIEVMHVGVPCRFQLIADLVAPITY